MGSILIENCSITDPPERLRVGLLALLVAAITFAAFMPVVGNDFVNWDDPEMVIFNPASHGLGPSHLAYAFTTTWFRHYHPLTWLSYGLDYVLWGLDARGYHLTNVILHALTAGILFLLSRRLLQAARGEAGPVVDAAAAVAALAFALPPLRVEVVAWVTARRDVLSGLFFFATLLAYVRAADALDGGHRGLYRRRLVLAVVAYVAALLSKSITMTLPAVLVLLDWYPLRRPLRDRRVWMEKLPFAALGVAGAVIAAWAVTAAEFTDEGLGQRLAMAGYSLAFYLGKTVVPVGLSPMYEMPDVLDPFEARFVATGVITLAATLAAVACRQRAPWLSAAWAYYAVTLLPVSGLAHAGHQLVYLRYSYLPGAAPAMLTGAAVAAAVAAWRAAQLRAAVLVAVCFGTVLGLAGWTLLARREALVWRNSETLWTAAIAVDPDCALCHHQLGIYLWWTRRPDDAEAEFRRALAIRPTYALAARNLASVLRERGIARHEAGNYEAAVRLFAEAASLVPGEPELIDRLARAQAALAARTAGGKPPG